MGSVLRIDPNVSIAEFWGGGDYLPLPCQQRRHFYPGKNLWMWRQAGACRRSIPVSVLCLDVGSRVRFG